MTDGSECSVRLWSHVSHICSKSVVIKNDKCFYSFGRCRQKKPSGMNGGHLNEVIKWERPKEVG